MRKEIFEQKSTEMEDFYIYYQKANSNQITFAVATANLDNTYIQSRLRKVKVSEDEVLLWNWRYDSPLKVKYSKIKKLTPLASVLRNY